MKLRRSSPLAKLYRWFYVTETMPVNYLYYLIKILFACLFSIPVLLLEIPLKIIGNERIFGAYFKYRENRIVRIFVSLTIILLTFLVLCALSPILIFFINPEFGSPLDTIIGIGMSTWGFILAVLVIYFGKKISNRICESNKCECIKIDWED